MWPKKLQKTGQHGGKSTRLACLILVSLVTITTVFGRPDVNVALNRPTFMSTIHSVAQYGGAYSPSKAVDGNRDTLSYKVDNSCVHTLFQTYPWWAVDLGVRLAVAGIRFTNRAESTGYRSDNFIVGLTDVSPDITAPILWNYDVCGQWPGVVGNGVTVYMKCKCGLPHRRYLIVQTPITEFMNFCEIEVNIRRWDWIFHAGQRMNNKVSNSFQVERRLSCLINCTLSPICDSYNYCPADKTCQLNTHDTPLIANSADIVDDNQWELYSSTYTTVV